MIRQARIALHIVARNRKISRKERLVVARLSRIADDVLLSLSILRPIVRPLEKRGALAPDDAEKLEYARCLVEFGASHEGRSLLQTIDLDSNPEAVLTYTYLHTRAWDWVTPLPLLKKLAAKPNIDEDTRLQIELNLGVCNLQGFAHFSVAQKIFEDVVAATSTNRHQRSHFTALQLLAQTHF